jgi:hypothetical protein
MHASCIYLLYQCVFTRWTALRRERAALAHMPRISASSAPARDRTRTQDHARVPIYMPGLGINIYLLLYVCLHDVWTRARTCPHVCANGGPAAHNGPRRIDDLPSASRRDGALPGRQGGAYRAQRGDTRGVPRADVRVERRRHGDHLRAEPRTVHPDARRSHVSAQMRGHPIAHAHARAHTDAARGRVCAAGPHRRSVHLGSQTRMEIDTCMNHASMYYTCACSSDGRPYGESASHSHTRRVLAHRRRPHAIARVRKITHAYPFTYPDFASIYKHIYCT